MEKNNINFSEKKCQSIVATIKDLFEQHRVNIFNTYLDNNNYDYRIIYKHELDEYINLKNFKVCELFELFKNANENDDYFLIQLSTKKLKSSCLLNILFSNVGSWKDLGNWLNTNPNILEQFNYKHFISDRMSRDFKELCQNLNEINMDVIDYVLFDGDTISEDWDKLYENTLKEAKEYEEE